MKANKHQFFIKILSSLTVLIVATIFIQSYLLYFNFEKIVLNTIEDNSVKSLSQISYSSQIMIDTAKQISNQLFFDDKVSRLLNYGNLDPVETYKLMINNTRFFYTIPYMESIYFYNREARSVYGKTKYGFDNFPDQELLKIIDQYTEYEQLKPIPRQVDFIASNNGIIPYTHYVFTFLFYGEPNVKTLPKSAVIINFSEAWIRNIINSMNLNNTNDIFILDKDNRVVLSNAYYDVFENLSNENYVREIVASKENKGYLISEIKDKKSLIVYVKAEDINWTFVQIIDYNTVTKGINNMRFVTLLIGLSILIAGLIMSYIASRRLYVPIGNILMHTDNLENEKRKNFLIIKQDFLIKLLKYDQLYNSKLLLDKFNTSAVSFDHRAPLLLVIFRIDHYRDYLNQYDANDRELYKFAVMNIVQELFAEHFSKNDMVDTGDDHLVLFLNYDEDRISVVRQNIEASVAKAQEAINKFYQISLSVTVSSLNKQNESLSQIYKETEEISAYRAFIGYERILFCDDIHLKSPETYIYPTNKEKTLVEYVLLGKIDEAKQIYHQIADETVHYPFFIYEMVISRLSYAFKAAIMDDEEIQAVGNPASLFSDLSVLEMKSEVDSLFMTMISEINDVVLAKEKKFKEKHQQEFIRKVMEFIKNNYTDPNISVESIAMELKMSSVYLGRVFRQSTSTSIADYILDLRMNYARELLKTTDASINDIAVKIGILNSNYFYTKFKKIYGMTPSEFKKIK